MHLFYASYTLSHYTNKNISFFTNHMINVSVIKLIVQLQSQLMLVILYQGSHLPVQLHITSTPTVLPSSLEEHSLVKAGMVHGICNPYVEQTLRRLLSSFLVIQEPEIKSTRPLNYG